MKTYSLVYSGSRKSSLSMLAILQPGLPGEMLIREGFSKPVFNRFLAKLVCYALNELSFTEADLSDLLQTIDGGNSSAARQAAEEITIKIDGAEKGISLKTHWQGASPAKPAASILERLAKKPEQTPAPNATPETPGEGGSEETPPQN